MAQHKTAGRSGERSTLQANASSETVASDSDLATVHTLSMMVQSDAVWIIGLFADIDQWSVPGDDLGTTFLSAGAVLVVAALTGDRTAETASRHTGMSWLFAEIVLAAMDLDNCWDMEWFADLH